MKAFNNLPRFPLLEAAEWLGVPHCVLCPWRSFLDQVERRFVVRGFVSLPVRSDCGFPEGDPLSTVAMALCNFIYHAYAKAFVPSVESLSYVDNLLGVSHGAFEVAQGLNTTRCLCEALALELDESKTYAWSTDAASRVMLRQLDLQVLDSKRELGGFISFGPHTRNSELVKRCENLRPLFAALARSKAPWSFKVSALPAKLWSIALHGVSGCPIPDSLVQSLRTQAARALKAAPAGSSPSLRLSLASPMTVDPGFFQLWACLSTLRHICAKQPRVLALWQEFMLRYDGRLFHGPFSKLLVVLNGINWHVGAPPFFQDEEGLSHDLLRLPKQGLRRLAERAWLQALAQAHRHRRDMADLLGLDCSLVRLDVDCMCPTAAARVAALQTGALMFGEAQARFDLTQSGNCTHCGVPDTKEHRICECPRYAATRALHQDVVDSWHVLPRCLSHHLLPPANPHATRLRACLHSLRDTSMHFHSGPADVSRQHLFTDGACAGFGSPEPALAGWGVVCASSGLIVALGALPGIFQSAPRAELQALLSAVCWIRRYDVQAAIWCDALSAAEGLNLLLDGGEPTVDWCNSDLWQCIWTHVQELAPGQLLVHHVPSHLDPLLCADEFEVWVATWNQYADTVAGLANLNRPADVQATHSAAVQYYQVMARTLRSLRCLYLEIATEHEMEGRQRHGQTPAWDAECTLEDLPLGQVRLHSVADLLPVNWQIALREKVGEAGWPIVKAVVGFVLTQDACSDLEYRISWLEILAMMKVEGSVFFSSEAPEVHQKTSVAEDLRSVRRAMHRFVQVFGVSDLRLYRLSGVSFGIGFPLDGLRIGVDVSLWVQARSLLQSFSAGHFCHSVSCLDRRF